MSPTYGTFLFDKSQIESFLNDINKGRPIRAETDKSFWDPSSLLTAAGCCLHMHMQRALLYSTQRTAHPPQVRAEAVEFESLSHYERAIRFYAELAKQPAFQATLKGLWRLGELQQGAQQPLRIPPPPITPN